MSETKCISDMLCTKARFYAQVYRDKQGFVIIINSGDRKMTFAGNLESRHSSPNFKTDWYTDRA
ncbi:hypothetical protein RSAG8_05790, partial [Rhizoctonia solani AG-8 WAC10335]